MTQVTGSEFASNAVLHTIGIRVVMETASGGGFGKLV